MDLKSFEFLLKDESGVKGYLVRACWKNYVCICIRCKEKFPLYLKETEFRYNYRHESIFNTLVQYVCDLTAM